MHDDLLIPTSYLVGKYRYISGCVVALALSAPIAWAQQVVFVPSCEPLVHVLESSYSSSDPREREDAIAWLRERRTPAAFQVLYRAKSDPSPAVRAQSLLGLAEIASECSLDSFQMRHLEPDERADLITLGSESGLIDLHALRSIAMDSSAGNAERASALIELMKLGEQVDAESWLPLLGSDDESIQMLAALSVMTPAPKTRPVAVAQDHATSILRKGVRDASEGRIASVVQTLAIAREVPTVHLSHWAAALLKACNAKPHQNAGSCHASHSGHCSLLIPTGQASGSGGQMCSKTHEQNPALSHPSRSGRSRVQAASTFAGIRHGSWMTSNEPARLTAGLSPRALTRSDHWQKNQGARPSRSPDLHRRAATQ